jgi:hypothetical protein
VCHFLFNDNIVKESDYHLSAPLFQRSKDSERVLQSLSDSIQKKSLEPQKTDRDGYTLERKVLWIKEIRITPLSLHPEEVQSQSIFSEPQAHNADAAELRLKSMSIGTVERGKELDAQFLLATASHYEPLFKLREEQIINPELLKDATFRFAKSEHDYDYFQIRALTKNQESSPILQAKSHQSERSIPFSTRKFILIGFCSNPIESGASL